MAPPEGQDLVMQLSEGMRIKRVGHNEEFMRWGDITEIINHRVKITDTPEGVTLIYIETQEGVRSHEGKPRPHFRNTNAWIGADGQLTLHQRGEWRNPRKKQLFRLHEGQSILFFDALKEVTRLTARSCGEEPLRERAPEGEVADYVLREAEKRGDSLSSRAWCSYALVELGCQRQLDDFFRLFPDFRRT